MLFRCGVKIIQTTCWGGGNDLSTDYAIKIVFKHEVITSSGSVYQEINPAEFNAEIVKDGSYYYIIVTGTNTVGKWRMYLELYDSIKDVDGSITGYDTSKPSEAYVWPSAMWSSFRHVEISDYSSNYSASEAFGYFQFEVKGATPTVDAKGFTHTYGEAFTYEITYTKGAQVVTYTQADENKRGDQGTYKEGVLAEYQLSFNVGAGGLTTEIPTEPGDYQVTVTVWQNGNYSTQSAGPFSFKINKRSLRIAWAKGDNPKNADIVYNLAGHNPYEYFTVYESTASEKDKLPKDIVIENEVTQEKRWYLEESNEKLDTDTVKKDADTYILKLVLDSESVSGGGYPQNLGEGGMAKYYTWETTSEAYTMPTGITVNDGSSLNISFVIKKYEDTQFEAVAKNRKYRDQDVPTAPESYKKVEGHEFYGTDNDILTGYITKEEYDANWENWQQYKTSHDDAATQYSQGFHSYLTTLVHINPFSAGDLKNKDVGTYYIIVYLAANSTGNPGYKNYAFYEDVKEFEIEKRPITIPSVKSKEGGGDYTYTGDVVHAELDNYQKTLDSGVNAIKEEPAYEKSKYPRATLSDNYISQTNAGVYYVAFSLRDPANNEWDKSGYEENKDKVFFEEHGGTDYLFLVWTLNRAAIDLPQATELTYKFDTAQEVQFNGKLTADGGDGYYYFKNNAPYGFIKVDSDGDNVSQYSATNAGKYKLYIKADNNHYVAGSKDNIENPKTEQPLLTIEWEIKKLNLTEYKVVDYSGRTTSELEYNGARQSFVLNGFSTSYVKYIQYALNGTARNRDGNTVTFKQAPELDQSSTAHYATQYLPQDSEVLLNATYAGTYTVTLTLRADYQNNCYWGNKEDPQTTYSTEFKITKATADVVWHPDGTTTFTYDGAEKVYDPKLGNTGATSTDKITIKPVYYKYDAEGEKPTEKLDGNPKTAGKYIAVVYYPDVTSNDISKRSNTNSNYNYLVEYAADSAKMTVFDNFDFKAGDIKTYTDVKGADGNVEGITCLLTINTSAVDRPYLKAVLGGALSKNEKENDAVIVPFKGKDSKYDFLAFVYFNDSLGSTGEYVWSDDIAELLTITPADGEGTERAEVKWNGDKTALDYYKFTIKLTNPNDYSWAAGSESIDNTYEFVFYLQITPTRITLPQIDGNELTKAADLTYSKAYTDAEQQFTGGISNYTTFSENYSDFSGVTANPINVYADNSGKIYGAENVVRGVDNAVEFYTVYIELTDQNNTVWGDSDGGFDHAERTFKYKITPVDIEVTWGATEQTFTGSELKPTAVIANMFGSKKTADVVTIVFELTTDDAADRATISGDKGSAKNAGNYTATVKNLTGDDAGNYTINATAPSNPFVIYKQNKVRPEPQTRDGYVYNKSAQTITFANSDSTIMEITDAKGEKAVTKEEIDGGSITTGTADGMLTLSATRAGTYTFKIKLTDTGNYYWGRTVDETHKLPDDQTADAYQEYSGDTAWTIAQKQVKAPSLLNQRNQAYNSENYFHPVFYGQNPSLAQKDPTSGETTPLSGKDVQEVTKVKYDNSSYYALVDGDWYVKFTFRYYKDSSDITDSLKENSKNAGKYTVVLTMVMDNDNGELTDYIWVENPDDDAQKTQFGNLVDTVDENAHTITLQYRISRGIYTLTFTATGWTYGEHKSQTVNGTQGTVELLLKRTNELPPPNVGFKNEIKNRSVEYYLVQGLEKTKVEDTDLVKNGKTDKPNDKEGNDPEYYPDWAPYKAGTYEARITYKENGTIVDDAPSLEELTFIAEFTIKQLAVTAKWDENKTEGVYSGLEQCRTAEVTNIVTTKDICTDMQSGDTHQDTDTVGVAVKITDEGYTTGDNGYPIDVKRGNENAVEAYKLALKEVTGEDAANYTIDGATNGTSTYTIQPLPISLKANNLQKTYGDELDASADLAKAGSVYNFGYDADSKNFIERDNTSFDDFSIYARKTADKDGEAVVKGTAAGEYHAVLFLAKNTERYKNYNITLTKGTYTVNKLKVNIVWADESFTYNGKDQYAEYNDAGANKYLVYFQGVQGLDGDSRGRVCLTPGISGAGTTFKDAGTYTFTLDEKPQPLQDNQNYEFNFVTAAKTELTHTYTIAKRHVYLKPNAITSEYGKPIDQRDALFKWLYAEGSADDLHKFVTDGGEVIAAWTAYGTEIYDGAGKIGFKTATEAVLDSKSNTVPLSKAGSYKTYIADLGGRELTNTQAYNNYEVTISGTAIHTLNKQKIEIKWDESQMVFTYDGTDQSYEGNNPKKQIAYFIDSQTGDKVYFPVKAVESDQATNAIEFKNVKAGGAKYWVYIDGIPDGSTMSGAYSENYELALPRDSTRYNEVEMRPRVVTIKATRISGHEYGENFAEALNYTTAGQKYTYAGDAWNLVADELAFVEDFEVPFRVVTTLTSQTEVGNHKNGFKLQVKDGAGYKDVEFTTDGTPGDYVYADNYNYQVMFDGSEEIQVIPRKVVLTIQQVTLTYGDDLVDIASKATLSREGGKPLANSDTDDTVYSVITLNGANDILKADDKYPNAGDYAVKVTRNSENYEITVKYTIGESPATEYTMTENEYTTAAGLYKINKAQINVTESTAYTGDYDGASHSAADKEKFKAEYFGETRTGSLGAVKADLALGGETTKLDGEQPNQLTVLFRSKDGADGSEEYPEEWLDPTVDEEALTLTTQGYTWSAEMPSFTHAGTYYVYYAVLAKNHEPVYGQNRVLKVVINQKKVTVSFGFSVYYGESIDADYTPEISKFKFDSFIEGETLQSGVHGYEEGTDKIKVSVPDYTAGTTTAGESGLDITLDFSGFQVTDYEFIGGENKLTVKQLPIVLEVNPNLTNTYYLNAAKSQEKKFDLTLLGEGDFTTATSSHTYRIKVKEGTLNYKGEPIEDIWAADYTLGERDVKIGQKIFTLKSDAYENYADEKTAAVNELGYEVTFSYNEGYDNKYEIEYNTHQYYKITPAEFNIGYLHGYGTTKANGTVAGRDYDESATHYALHKGQFHGDEGAGAETDSPADFATSADGQEIEWTFYLAKASSEEGNYNTEEFWQGKDTTTTIPRIIDVGEYIIYYRLKLANHTTAYGFKKAKVNKVTSTTWSTPYQLGSVASGNNAWTYGEGGPQHAKGYYETTYKETLPLAQFWRKDDGSVNYPKVTLNKDGATIATYSNDPSGKTVLSWLAQEGDGYKNGALLDAGTYTVEYTLEGTLNYDAPAKGTFTFNVLKKQLTVTPKNISIVYGENYESKKSVTIEGFVNGQTQQSIFGNALPAFEVTKGNVPYAPGYLNGAVSDEYVIKLTTSGSDFDALLNGGAAKNYSIAATWSSANGGYKTGTMEVTQREITVTFGALSNSYNYNISEPEFKDPYIAWNQAIENNDRTLITGITVTNSTGAPILTGDMNGNWYKNYVFSYTTEAIHFVEGTNLGSEAKGTNNYNPNPYEITGAVYGADNEEYYKHSKNYTVSFQKGTYQINKARLNAKPTLPDNLVYDGQPKVATGVAGMSGVTFTLYYSKLLSGNYDGGEFEDRTINAPTDAGIYRVSLDASSENYIASTSSVQMIITPKEVYITPQLQSKAGGDFAEFNQSAVYYKDEFKVIPLYGKEGKTNGDGQIIAADNEKFIVTVTYKFNNSDSVEKVIAAGVYDVIFATTNTNYTLKVTLPQENGAGFTLGTNITETEFTVQPKPIEKPTGPRVGSNSKTYDGEAYAFIVNGFNTETDHEERPALKITFNGENAATAGATLTVGATLEDSKYTWNVTGAKTYRVVVSFDSANYIWSDSQNRSEVPFTYTINKKTLYVKAADTTITYGDAFDTLSINLLFSDSDGGTYSADGGFVKDEKAAEEIHGYTTAASLFSASGYAVSSNAGLTYDITVLIAQLSADNYEIKAATKLGKLSVEQRDLTLTIKDGSMEYTGNAPEITPTSMVEVKAGSSIAEAAGDSMGSLNVSFKVEGVIKDGVYDGSNLVGAGAHRLTPSYSNTNYNITFEGNWHGEERDSYNGKAGVYTINQKTLTVTVGVNYKGAGAWTKDGTITYGDEVKDYIAVNYSGWVKNDASGIKPNAEYVFTALKDDVAYQAGASHAGDTYTLDISNKDAEFFRDYKISVVTGTIKVVSRYITVSVENNVFEHGDGGYNDYKEIPAVPVYADAEGGHSPIIGNELYKPQAELTYTGNLADETSLTDSVPKRVGNYQVTVALKQNSNNDYDYKFGSAETSRALSYKITPQKIEVKFSSTSLDLSAFDSGEGENELIGYISDIMEVSAYTFAEVDAHEKAVFEGGRMVMKFTSVGTGSATIILTGNHQYDYRFVAAGNEEGVTSITLTFSVSSSAIDFHVDITGWTYGEYNELTNLPKPRSSEIPEDKLQSAVIAYTYYTFEDEDTYTEWQTLLKRYEDGQMDNAAHQDLRSRLEALQCSLVPPTNAGWYMVRARLSEMQEQGITGSFAGAVFIISKKQLAKPTLENPEIHEGECTYNKEEHYLTLKDYDNATMNATVDNGATIRIETENVNIYALNHNTYTVTVTLVDSNNYEWDEAAGAIDGKVEITFEIKQAQDEISGFSELTVTYGEEIAFAAESKFEAAITYKYAVGDYSAEAEKKEGLPTDAGTYTVFAFSAADGSEYSNWTGAEAHVKLTINRAELTLSVKDAGVVYGEDLPAQFDYEVSGWKNGDDESLLETLRSVLEGKLSYAADGYVNGTSAYGASCDITATLTPVVLEGDLKNYTVGESVEKGTLTVEKRKILIDISDELNYYYSGNVYTLEDKSSPENEGFWKAESNPDLGYYTVYGNDVITVRFGIPENAIKAGVYTITGSTVQTDALNNYEVEFANGRLLISPNEVTISNVSVKKDGGDKIIYNHGEEIGLTVTYSATFYDEQGRSTTVDNIVAGTSSGAFKFVHFFKVSWTGRANNASAEYGNNDVEPTAAGTYRVSIELNRDGIDESSIQAVAGSTNFVIERYTLAQSALQEQIDATTYTYTGNEQGPTQSIVEGLCDDAYGRGNLYRVLTCTREVNKGVYQNITVQLTDANNYVWSDTANDTVTLSFTIEAITDLTLEFTAYDEGKAKWNYDGTVHMDLFKASPNKLGDLSAQYRYYVQEKAEAPTWTNISEAEANGWTLISTNSLTAGASNAATNAGKRWIVAVIFSREGNFNEAATEVKGYTVEQRTVNVTVYGGTDGATAGADFTAGTYTPDLTFDALNKPDWTAAGLGTESELPSGIRWTTIFNSSMLTLGYTGNAWSGKTFNEGGKIEAGSYTITAALQPSAQTNFKIGEVTAGKYVVRRSPLYGDTIQVKSIVYDGTAHEPKDFIQEAAYGALWDATGDSQTNAGSYPFNATLKEEAAYNYYWFVNGNDATAEEINRNRQLTMTIERATIKINGGTFTYYNGESQKTVNFDASSSSTNKTSWTYGDNITQVNATAVVQTLQNKPLSGIEPVIYYANASMGSIIWDTTMPTDAGTYYVCLFVAQTQNYSSVYSATKTGGSSGAYTFDGIYITLTIDKKELPVPSIPEGSYSYTGSEQSVAITNFNSDYMNITNHEAGWSYSYGGEDGKGVTISATNQGTYNITVALRYSNNYTFTGGRTSVTLQWTISESPNNITKDTIPDNVIYGDEGWEITAEANFGDVVITYRAVTDFDDADKANGDYVSQKPKNAGNYWVKLYVKGNSNYASVTDYRRFTIKKATLTGTINYAEIIYGEEEPEFGFEVSGFKYNEQRNSFVITAEFESTYTTGNDKGDYEITLKGQATISSDNYNITFPGNGTLHVNPKPITVNIKTPKPVPYAEGAAPDFDRTKDGWEVVEEDGLYGEDEIEIKLVLEHEDELDYKYGKGSYIIDGEAVAGGKTDNYSITFRSGALQIVEAEIAIAKINADNTVYGSVEAATFNIDGKGENLVSGYKYRGEEVVIKVKYFVDNAEPSENLPENAGTYNVRLVLDGTDQGNYVLTGSTEATFVVDKKSIDSNSVVEKVNGTTYTYNNTAQGPEKAAIEGYSTELFGAADLYTVKELSKQTDAGEYTYKLQINNSNYRWESTDTGEVTATWKINQAANSIQWQDEPQDVVYGKSYSVTATATWEGEGIKITYAAYKEGEDYLAEDWFTGLPANVGKYVIRALAEGTSNYESAEIQKQINITAAELTVKIGSPTVKYGDELGPIELTVEGYQTPYNGTVAGTPDDADTSGWTVYESTFRSYLKHDYAPGKTVATYPITYTNGECTFGNYVIKAEGVTQGTITVVQRELNIVIENQQFVYDSKYATSAPDIDSTGWRPAEGFSVYGEDRDKLGITLCVSESAPYEVGVEYTIEFKTVENDTNKNYVITVAYDSYGKLTFTPMDLDIQPDPGVEGGEIKGGLAITPDIAEGNPNKEVDDKPQLGAVTITYGDDYTAAVYFNGTRYEEGQEFSEGVYVHFIYTLIVANSSPAGPEIAGISLFSARSGEYAHPTDAGTYSVKLVFTTNPVGADGLYTEAQNYTLKGNFETTVIISKKQLDHTLIEKAVDGEGKNYVYNNKSQGPDAATIAGYSATLYNVPSLYTVEGLTKEENAGTYQYRLKIEDSAFKNYRWAETDNQIVTVSWTLSQATNKLTWQNKQETATYGVSYDISATADFGDVNYAYAAYKAGGSYDTGDWTLGLPAYVGEYAIRAYVNGTANYTGLDEMIEKFTITRATLTVKIEDQEIIYGENYAEFTLTVTGYQKPYNGTVAGTTDDAATSGWVLKIAQFRSSIQVQKDGVSYSLGSNVGDYTVTYSGGDITLDNYTIVASAVQGGTLKVKQRALTVVIEDQFMLYDKTYANEDPNPDDTKWHIDDGSVLLEKDKKHLGIGVYLKDKGAAPYYADGTKYVIDGEYTANEYNKNYTITFVPAYLTLTKQDITVDSIKITNNNPILTGVTYGDEYTVKVVLGDREYGVGAVLPCGAKVRLLFAESILEGVGDTGETQPTDAGTYEVGYALDGTDSRNYTLSGVYITSYTIAKRVLLTEYAQTKASAQPYFKPTYTGKAQGISADDLNAFIALMKEDGNFLLANDRSNDPFTATSEQGENVGKYAVHLKLTDAIAKNYMWDTTNSDTADINFEIKKADNSVSLTVYGGQTASWEYDGYEAGTDPALTVEPHKGFYSFEATFGKSTAQYKFYKVERDGDKPIDYTPVEVGEYKLQIVIPDTENYAGCSSNTLAINITPRRLTVSFRDQSLMGGEYGSTILPASAVLAYYGGEPSSHNMFLSRVTLEYAYYGTSYDNTWSHTPEEYIAEAPTKAGEYKIRVRIGINEKSESYAYNRNFMLVDEKGEKITSIEGDFKITKARVYSDLLTVKTFEWDGVVHSAVDAVKDNDDYGTIFEVKNEFNVSFKSVGSYDFRIHLIDPDNYCWVPDDNQDWRLLTYSIVATDGTGRNITIVEFYGIPTNSSELELPYSQAGAPNATEVAYYDEGVTHHFKYGTDFVLLYAPLNTDTPKQVLSWKGKDENYAPDGWSREIFLDAGRYTAIAWIDTDEFKGYSGQIQYSISRLEVRVLMNTVKDGVYNDSEPEFSIYGYYESDFTITGELKPDAKARRFFPQLDLSDNDKFLPHTVYYRGTGDTVYERSTVMPTEAGTYIREFELSANYTCNTGAITCEFRIEPKQISVADIQLSNGAVLYDGTRHFIDKEFVESFLGGGVIEVVGGLPVTEGVVDVREGGYAVDLKLLDTRNYAWATGERSEYTTAYFVVSKSFVELAAPTVLGWAYGAEHAAPTVSGKFESGTEFGGRVIYEYSVPGTGIWTVNEPVNAGEYLVHAKVEENANYEGLVSPASTFTITRAKLAKPTAGNSVTDVGGVWTFAPENYSGEVEQISGHVAYYDGTYRAAISIVDKANYEWEDGSQEDITIEWTALPNMTIFYIVVASLSGLAILLAVAAIPLGIAARRKKSRQNNSGEVEND